MPVLAVPGAVGFGAYTVGGRVGTPKVYLINTLADNSDAPVATSGTNTFTSSFRSAIKASGSRYIIPMIGGTVTLTIDDPIYNRGTGSILVKDDYFTILGGMCPGEGMTIVGDVRIDCVNFIIENMRFRGDDNFSGAKDNDSFSIGRASSVGTCDHGYVKDCSMSWGTDNNCSVAGAKDITYDNCIMGAAVSDEGIQARGPQVGSPPYTTRVTFFRNILYMGHERSPAIRLGDAEVYNMFVTGFVVSRKVLLHARSNTMRVNYQGNIMKYLDPDVPSGDFRRPVIEYYDGEDPLLFGKFNNTSSIYYMDNWDEVYRTSNAIVDAQTETDYDNSPTTEGTFSGGTGHAATDVITMSDGTLVTVDTVSGGVVTEFTINSSSAGASLPAVAITQSSTTGSGADFSLTPEWDNFPAQDTMVYFAPEGGGTVTSMTYPTTPIDFSSSDYVLPTVLSTDAMVTHSTASDGPGAQTVRDASAAFTTFRDSYDTTIRTNIALSPTRGDRWPSSALLTDITQAGGMPTLADGLPLGAAFDDANGDGIPDSYTLPTGALWYHIRSLDGYTFLEGYRWSLTRYWDTDPVNLPVNIVELTYIVTAETYTSLTGLSVEADGLNIDTVAFVPTNNKVSIRFTTTVGVTFDV